MDLGEAVNKCVLNKEPTSNGNIMEHSRDPGKCWKIASFISLVPDFTQPY